MSTIEANTIEISPALLKPWLPQRPDDSHKGSFGSALIVAGSLRYTGAALLAGSACLRSGVGLLSMAVPRILHAPLAGHLPEAIWEPLAEAEGTLCPSALPRLSQAMPNKTALLIGPGLGLTDSSRAFAREFISSILAKHKDLPTVIDADMLTLLSEMPNWHTFLPSHTVLTPHPGEMARLTGYTCEHIQANRATLAQALAQEKGVILVLKGANTLVASPDGTVRQLHFANAVLAHAGSGDVLAGILVGLLAQGVPAFEAASLAVWLHAKCGLLALEKRKHTASALPSDLVNHLGHALSELENA